ncbi:MAG: hypothetical protein ACTS22_01135 [Phycisphaerales bacterium]
MRTIIRAIGVLATLHLLLLIGGGAWLVASDRVDERRVEAVVSMFRETVAARDAREAAEEADQAAGDLEGRELSEVPLTAEQQIDRKLRSSEADRQTIQRMRRDVEDLRRALQTERAQLDQSRAAFLAEREAFDAERERIRLTEGEEQFQAALLTLMTMRSKQAYTLVNETIENNAEGMSIATAYLDNLPPKNRAGILGEFEKNDPELAAELLERLRTRGVEAPPDGRD